MWTTLSPEEAVPNDHPLRPIRAVVNGILADLSPEFSKLYARRGRPSIPPERLLRALLLQAFFSIRSEPLLLEQLRYNLLFRWFVGLSEEIFGWTKTVGNLRKLHFIGLRLVGESVRWTSIAFNLVRMRNLGVA
jgi:transposase